MLASLTKIIISIILPVLFSFLLYNAQRHTSFRKIPYWAEQLIIGVIFGGIAVISTELSTDIGGALINVRDAAPLSAGIIFGGPAGIIAGIIGGIGRLFTSFWGVGEFTRLACSIATVLSGFFAAIMRRFLFESKRPTIFYGLILGIITEVLHMLLIFLTNLDDIYGAFYYVQSCTFVMIMANSTAVVLSMLVTYPIGRKKSSTSTRNSSRQADIIKSSLPDPFQANSHNLRKREKSISQSFQRYLLISVIIAFSVTGFLTFMLQSHIGIEDIDRLLKINLTDAEISLSEKVNYDYSDIYTKEELSMPEIRSLIQELKSGDLENFAMNWHIGYNGCIMLIDDKGMIVSDRDGHNDKIFSDESAGLDLSSIEQNSVFLTEIHGVNSYCICCKSNGYYILVSIPKSEMLLTRNISVYNTVFMELIIFFAMFVLIYVLINKIAVDKIKSINSSLAKITNGDLNEKVSVRTNKEFSKLSDDINSTVDTLKHYIDEANARIDSELEFAKRIQLSALPSVFPPYPSRTDFDIFASMNAAKEVGGDFYDFYLLGDDRLAILIADVSGKGIPAALFMMKAKAIIKSLVESGLGACEALTQANKQLCENNTALMFVTVWLGIIDLKTGTLSYSNAGHNPPALRHNGGEFEYLSTKANFVLGGMDFIAYKPYELQLAQGDEIYLYTDGVTEAADNENRLFGEARLLESLNSNKNLCVKELCEAVKKDVDKFSSGAPQTDDITMLAVRLNHIKSENCISISPSPASMKAVADFVESKIDSFAVGKKSKAKLMIAVDEIYSNIVNYSEADNAEVSIFNKDGKAILVFSDNGTPFNPLTAQAPDIKLPGSERKIGGLGIHLVKNTAESVNYSYENNRNILTAVFSLQ